MILGAAYIDKYFVTEDSFESRDRRKKFLALYTLSTAVHVNTLYSEML